MNPKTREEQKTYTLSELIGNERKWRHICLGLGPGVTHAVCGEPFIPTKLLDKSNLSGMCPDCLRIARKNGWV